MAASGVDKFFCPRDRASRYLQVLVPRAAQGFTLHFNARGSPSILLYVRLIPRYSLISGGRMVIS